MNVLGYEITRGQEPNMPCGEEAENLFLGELCWRFSSYLFHPLLSDFNLAFGIDDIGTGVRGEIWMSQPVNAREQTREIQKYRA